LQNSFTSATINPQKYPKPPEVIRAALLFYPANRGNPACFRYFCSEILSVQPYNSSMKNLPMVYVETSVVSYLTARASRDIIMLANQQITRQWWESDSERFKCVISAIVEVEARAGDAVAAAQRLAIIENLPYLAITDDVEELAERLLTKLQLPDKAERDALHIACASIHAADYLVTWNMKHIAGAEVRRQIEKLLTAFGCPIPIICTPFELLSTSESNDNDSL
jgi:predicted nucleic acid-binding protein